MLLPLPADAPDTPDCETVHVNVVPVTLLVNAIDDAVPEQIDCDAGVAITFGVGLTVIVTFIGVPGHPFAVGVMV